MDRYKGRSEDDGEKTSFGWPAKAANHAVTEQDAIFFTCFSDVIDARMASRTQESLSLADADKSPTADVSPPPTTAQDPIRFSPSEWQTLYVEALYTIRHRIGQNPNASSDHELYDYVQSAFGVSAAAHDRLMAKACMEKSPVVVLEVAVVEAKELEAKDADGFSDPYCMLGIVSSAAGAETTDNDGDKSGKTAVDRIPARFIKTTSVKENTLSPVWNEKFCFDLSDVKTDVLHLDIWDHDDDFSVADSARRLNQVKGLKGLGRYFKQIAQSARRAHTDSNPATQTLDDFLGTVDIPIADIPSTGLDIWTDLKARSERSKVEGQLHLRLSLATREERDLPEDERQFETKQHCDLMTIFIDHELRKSQSEATVWTGELSPPANAILHQHAVQGDITNAQHAICLWIAMSRKFCDQPFDWSLLVTCLHELNTKWNPEHVYTEEEFAVAESFDAVVKFCMQLMTQIFTSSRVTWTSEGLQGVLTCLQSLYDSPVFKRCCVFKRELKSEIFATIKKSSNVRYQRLQAARCSKLPQEADDTYVFIDGYVSMLDKLTHCLRSAHHLYNPIFLQVMNMDYFGLSYRETYGQLCGDIAKDLKVVGELVSERAIDDSLSLWLEAGMIKPVMRLYVAVADFINLQQLLSRSDAEKLSSLGCGHVFTGHVTRWLNVLRHVVLQRVQRAVELHTVDAAAETDTEVMQSVSSVDVIFTFGQVLSLRECFEFPDSNFTKSFVLSATKTLCLAALTYAELIHGKLQEAGYYDSVVEQFDVTDQLCMTVNGVEQVRLAMLALPGALEFDKTPSEGDTSPHTIITTTDERMCASLRLVADHIADNMRADIKKFVFHLCWAPERALSQDAVGKLIDYLDSNLMTLNSNLLRSNFRRILNSIWQEVLEEFDDVLARPDEELREATWLPARLMESLQIMLEFFHASGKGLDLSDINCPLYRHLHQQLELIQTPTGELLQKYFADKIKQQQQTTDYRGGMLSVRVYYNHSAKLLTVEVLSAKRLLPQDSNGSSDPYVVVELHPTHLFPGQQPQQTNVIRRTLNPSFNETFSFEVTEKQCTQSGACVLLSIMDHDVISANDFAGEVCIGLQQVIASKGMGSSALLPLNLPIVNYDAPPTTFTVGKCRHGIVAALSMKFDEPATVELAEKRRHIDYTKHRQQAE